MSGTVLHLNVIQRLLWFRLRFDLYFDFLIFRKRNQDLFNAMGSMFTAVLFLGVQYCSSVQPIVSVERTVFYREKAAGMYAGIPWALAQVIV